MGTEEDRCTAEAHRSRVGLAIGLDGWGDPCAARPCQRPQAGTAAGLRQRTIAASRGAERGVDGRSQSWFRTRDGWRCEALTVMDASSRYLLALEATGSTA